MQSPKFGGEMPDWWPTVVVGEAWGCPPDAVLTKPSYWYHRALVKLRAEAFVAQVQHDKHKG